MRGSGGHNRTHDTVEDYPRIDSFRLYRFLRGDKYLGLHDVVTYPSSAQPDIVYHVQRNKMEILTGYKYSPLFLVEVPGINGKGVRVFFGCPHCRRRVRYLYRKNSGYMCRKCLNANYRIQQINGQNKRRRQMLDIVENKLGYKRWRAEHPDSSIEGLCEIQRPRYMRHDKYNKLIADLMRLQSEYEEAELESLLKFLPRGWLNDIFCKE